jgi:hypothetical protein
MRSFVKFSLIVLLAVVAVKFLPALALAGVVAGLMLGLVVLGGLSLAAVLLLLALGVGLLLTPLWLPVLAVVGLVALVRRFTRATAVA